MIIHRWISVAPISRGCNLSCDYCYISHHENNKRESTTYKYSMKHMLTALKKERLGGVCMFNICADGESLIALNIEEFILGILMEGHYVSVVTNCTPSKVIEQLLNKGENYLDQLVFKCSLHYKELKKRGLLRCFSDNVKRLKSKGVSFTVECVACDDILEDIEEIKEYCMAEFGALPHLLTGRSEKIEGEYNRFGSKLSMAEYVNTWNQFDSALFSYQLENFEEPYNEYFCHAGEYNGILSLETGMLHPCPGNHMAVCNMFEDLNNPIKFAPVSRACPLKTCFMSHVFNGLCGDCFEDKTINYRFADFRNRVCTDGTEWLSPTIKDVYSHRCSESHEKMSEEEKNAWNALMKHRYKQDDETNIEALASCFEKKLDEMDIKTVIIYGFGSTGEWLYNILKGTQVEVISAIDKNNSKVEAEIPVHNLGDDIEVADAVIVSIYDVYASIIDELKQAYPKVRFLSIVDMI